MLQYTKYKKVITKASSWDLQFLC